MNRITKVFNFENVVIFGMITGVLPDNLRSQYQKEVQEIEYRLQHQDLQEESTEGYMSYEEIPQPDRHQQQLLATQQPHSSNQRQDPQQNQHQTHKSSLRKLVCLERLSMRLYLCVIGTLRLKKMQKVN